MIRWTLQRRYSAWSARCICRELARQARLKRESGKENDSQWLTVVDSPDWDSERAAVDEALREEAQKRGLR